MEDREEPESRSPRIQGPGTCCKGLSHFCPFAYPDLVFSIAQSAPNMVQALGNGFLTAEVTFDTAEKELGIRQTDWLGWKQSAGRKGLCEMQADMTGCPVEAAGLGFHNLNRVRLGRRQSALGIFRVTFWTGCS